MREKMKDKTVCFTGHRRIPDAQYNELHRRLENVIVALVESGHRFFGAGGALGFDTMAAQTVLALKKQYPYIRFILVLPCLSQAKKWKKPDQIVYERIKAQADKIVYTGREYTKDCMHRRNCYLVDCSSICVCYLTKSTGGTAYTVNYARRRGVKIISMIE